MGSQKLMLREMQKTRLGLWSFKGKQSLYQGCLYDIFELRICGCETFCALLGQWKLLSWGWKSTVIYKGPVLLRWNLLGSISSASSYRTVVQQGVGQGCSTNWQQDLAKDVQTSPTWYLFCRMKGSWRAAEALVHVAGSESPWREA